MRSHTVPWRKYLFRPGGAGEEGEGLKRVEEAGLARAKEEGLEKGLRVGWVGSARGGFDEGDGEVDVTEDGADGEGLAECGC